MGIESMAAMPLISLTIALPALGALAVAISPHDQARVHRMLAALFSVGAFVVSLGIWSGFDVALPGFQMVEDVAGLPFSARYQVGVDGINLLLVLLTTLVTPLAIIGAFGAVKMRTREFYLAMLLLESCILGTLVSMDLLLFYLFWEFMLVPMALIIGVWGGPRRVYAAVKFFLYTFLGSVLMLVGIIYLNVTSEASGFSYLDFVASPVSAPEQMWLFLAFGLAFAVKVPLWPFHTWLPDAHVEAPTPGSVILAAVMLKMGTYGFLRFAIPLFPEAAGAFALPVMVLGAVGIVIGSLVAYAQEDIKRLVAYSSVAHLGLVMLGLFAFSQEAVEGAILQMVNHGISTGALFLLVGMLYERRHTRMMSDFGGIARPMKRFAAFLVIMALASIGLPATNGFVGEFLILAGTVREGLSAGPGPVQTTLLILAVIGTSGVVLGAIYMLTMVRRVLFGPITHAQNEHLRDTTVREFALLAVLTALVFAIGVQPDVFLSRTRASVHELVVQYHGAIEKGRGAP